MALGKQRKAVPEEKGQAKNPVVIAAAAAIVFVILSLCFRGCDNDKTIITTRFVDNYGHTMLLQKYNGIEGIVDDPECARCKAMRQNEMINAIIIAFDSLEVRVVE